MYHNKKSILFLSLSMLFLFLTKQSFAQYPGMKAIYSQMNSRLQSQQMNMMNRTMSFSQFKRSENSSRIAGAFNKYNYLVKMNDGTVKTVKSYIYIDTILHKDYLLFINKSLSKSDTAHREQKIYADKTLSIGRIFGGMENSEDSTQNIPTTYFTGMATDSCWQFKIQPGPIALYSFVSEKESDSELFDPSTIVAIQYNDGAISRLDLAVLKNFILADEKAMKYFDKKDYYSAIKRFDKDSKKGK